MTRPLYDVKEPYLGTGLLDTYTFDFKIEALTQLEIVELDDTGAETQRVRGDDVTYLSSVTFDPTEGGGTVVLAANLTANYRLLLLLANDAPTQPYPFRNKNSWTLKRMEMALDFILGAVQRTAYRAKQALRFHDSEDEETLDGMLPPGVVNFPGSYLKVNDTGDGFEYGVDLAGLVDAAFPTPSINNQVAKWDSGSGTWVAALHGGGLVTKATQTIAAAAKIALDTGIQQLVKVQGNAGTQTTDTSPFSGTLQDGMIVTILGVNETNKVIVPYSDTVDGCMLKGDCYLGASDTLTLVYDIATRRFYEISRN